MINLLLSRTSRRGVLFGVALLTLQGCASLNGATHYQSVVMDETVLEQCTRETPPVEGFWNPTLALTRQLEKNLSMLNGATAPRLPDTPQFSMDVSNYTYQYAGVVVEGRKLVYVNAFYNRSKVYIDNWQYEPVSVCGGYTHFWGALYDPVAQTFSDLTFNAASKGRPAIKIGRRYQEMISSR